MEGSATADLIYADNAATTRIDDCVFDAMLPYIREEFYNPSAVYFPAQKCSDAVEKARNIIADCINCLPEEIYFTSGGTESDNTAIKCVSVKDAGIVTVKSEHKAVLNSCLSMQKNGCSVYYADVMRDGVIDIDCYKKLVTENIGLASVMLANNETGTVQNISALSDIAHSKGVFFHTDAVQACGHINVDVKALGADMLSASAHKFNGPKGVGFLYVKKGTPIKSFVVGGSQENGLRAGTLNVAGIVGMAAALKSNCDNLNKNTEYISSIEKCFLAELDKTGLKYMRNGGGLPGLISISFPGYDAESLVHRLDFKGICVSAGAACDSRQTRISHVLGAINVPEEYAYGTLRFSFGKYNTPEEIKKIISALTEILSDI